ncbi:MAG TPA: regulatory protein RecX [Clostridiaceae bacterium]|nr:regulatory protein RecX [Clostridiaceae bacterium]
MSEKTFDKLREKAVKYLGLRRAKSSGQIRQRLRRETSDEELIEAVVAYLQDIDYVNDRRAGQLMMKSFRGRRSRSRFAVQYSLRQKGIPGNIAEELANSGPADHESAAELIRSQFNSINEDDRQRASTLLRRRGYNYEVITEVVNKCLAENRSTQQ